MATTWIRGRGDTRPHAIEAGFVGPHYAFSKPVSPDYAASIEKNAPHPMAIPAEQDGPGY